MFDLAALERPPAWCTPSSRRPRSTPGRCWLRAAGAEVWVKHENHTPTGAFKVRGGLTYMDRLQRERAGGAAASSPPPAATMARAWPLPARAPACR